jgi:hypothetical protein
MKLRLIAAALVVAAAPGSGVAGLPRTVPDPACAPSYAGTSGVIGMPGDPGLGRAAEGGEPAPPDVVAQLPSTIAIRANTETFNRTYDFAVHGGRIYARALGAPDVWRAIGLPACLDGNVSEISADGDTLLATDLDRWIYTVSLGVPSPAAAGWTRRWGPFFWTDMGMQIPADVVSWAASDLSAGEDGTFTDRAGNHHEPFGILTVYLLRGDGRTITTLDPWLPSDESREVCTPARGTTHIAGLSGSGSTVATVDRAGRISTRLYEFDVAGANTVFYDYAWEDQTGVDGPRVQLPAPDWVAQPAVPGRITDRIGLQKLFTMPTGRLVRVEGLDAGAHTGYWEKDIADLDPEAWTFVRTDTPLLGRPLPLEPVEGFEPEDLQYVGAVDGWQAEILDFNPYCSPATLRIHPTGSEPLDLILHSVDGLRQERRGRGLDADARGYRSAVEVPLETWEDRASLPAEVRAFLERWFSASRFVDGPLTATRSTVRIGVPCWTFARGDIADNAVPSATRDLGALFAGVMAAQEEGRSPSACTAPYGAP